MYNEAGFTGLEFESHSPEQIEGRFQRHLWG
jgi:hypothetical protein